MDFLKVVQKKKVFLLGTHIYQDSVNASQQWWRAEYSIRKSKLHRQFRSIFIHTAMHEPLMSCDWWQQ